MLSRLRRGRGPGEEPPGDQSAGQQEEEQDPEDPPEPEHSVTPGRTVDDTGEGRKTRQGRFGNLTGRFFRGNRDNGGGDGDPLSPPGVQDFAAARGDLDEENLEGNTTSGHMTELRPGQVLDAGEQSELFMQFRHNSLTGQTRPSQAQTEVARRGKHNEETLGLIREDRPYMFQDVVNKMEQRLTMLQEAGDSNVVSVKAGKPTRRQLDSQLGKPGHELETITEAPAPTAGEDLDQEEPRQRVSSGGQENKEPSKRFLDDDGIMLSLPDPVKRFRERPSWRFDLDAVYLEHRVVMPSVEPVSAIEQEQHFTLDVEVSHLEVTADPLMAREEYLMAQLMTMMRDFKRRELVGLADFYAAKLGALEETLLVAREDLFSAVERHHEGLAGRDSDGELAALMDNCAKLEIQVAETRQLKEEEELKTAEAAENMAKLYFKIEALRAQQGYRLTSQKLEMQMVRYDADRVELQTQKSRNELDAELLVAEGEDLAGMDVAPRLFSIQPAVGGFRLRRVESTCAAHMKEVRMLHEQQANLLGRESVAADSDELQEVQQRLVELGPAPRRLTRPEADLRKAIKRARRKVEKGEYGVPRISRPMPVLIEEEIPDEEDSTLPQEERSRRKRVRGTGYYVKLLMNGSYLAGKSEVRYMREDFTLDFLDVFRVKVRRWPEVGVLQLWRKGMVRDSFVSDIPLNIPGADPGSAHEDITPVQYSWSASMPFTPDWPPPGSGEEGVSPLKAFIIPDRSIFGGGSLWVRARWMADEEDRQHDFSASVMGFRNPLADAEAAGEQGVRPLMPQPPVRGVHGDLGLRRGVVGAAGRVNKAHLAEWLGRAGLDPNDPRNAWYVELLKTREAQAAAAGRQVDGYFRLDVAEEILLLPTQASDGRAKFLTSRWEMGPGYTGALTSRELKLTTKDMRREKDRGLERGRPFIAAPLDSQMLADEATALIEGLHSFEAVDGGDVRGNPLVRMFGAAGAGGRDTTSNKLAEREKAIQAFILSIKSRATSRAKAARRYQNIKTEDVVRDLMLPQFRLDLSALASAFAPARRFGPVQRKAAPLASHPRTIYLAVTVIKATNLPQRSDGGGGTDFGRARRSALLDEEEEDLGGYGTKASVAQQRARGMDTGDFGRSVTSPASRARSGGSVLSPFVEVNFQGKDAKSASATSSAGAAVWNDEIHLAFQLPNNADFSPSAMASCKDEVVISVYDKVMRDNKTVVTKDEKGGGEKMCIHWSKRLLGTLRMSIGAIYRAMEISGTFELEMPAVMAGYRPIVSAGDGKPRLPSLQLVVGFSPSLEMLPYSPEEELRSSEADDVTRHAYRWMTDVYALKQCQRRYVKAMAVDAQGKASLLCRYVGASWELPEGYEEGDREAIQRRVARLVSLVPFVRDNEMRSLRHDMWTTCAKFLELAMGDGEEHATLLAGYFRAIGVQCYVVLGTSLCDAEAAWVLTNSLGTGVGSEDHEGLKLDPAALQLWDPATGRAYGVKDTACQLRELQHCTGPTTQIGTVFDNANIWANIQRSGDPAEIKWDLKDSGSWKPFFGSQLAYRTVKTLQPEIKRDTHYRKEHSLGKNFYDGLEKRAEQCSWSVLSDQRKRKTRQSTERATRFAQDFLKRDFFGSKERIDELEAFHEAGAGNGASVAQAEACAALSAKHNESLRGRLGSRRVVEDFLGHLFCLPMNENFRKEVQGAVTRTGLDTLPADWQFAIAGHVVKKRVPFACAIWVYIAAIRSP